MSVPGTAGQTPSFAIVRTGSGPDTIFSTRETSNKPQLVVGGGEEPPPPTNQAPTVNAGSDISISEPGTYELRLTASDGTLTAEDRVTVTVAAALTNRGPAT